MLRRTLIVTSLVSMIVVLAFGPAFAAAPFKVNSTTPANGATNVALNSAVTIAWNRNVDCGTVNTTNITISAGGWTLSSCGANQAVFSPSGQEPATTYAVNVSTAVTDTSNQAMKSAYSMSYTTASVAAAPAGYTVVAKSGGDYEDPVFAMSPSELDSWCGTPSVDNPCLMKIRPGIYSLLAQALIVPSFVEVEGSGGATVVTSQISFADTIWSGVNGDTATVVLRGNTALRNLVVENISAENGIAVLVKQPDTPGEVVIENVTALAAPTTENITGDHGGIVAQGPPLTGVLDVTVREVDSFVSASSVATNGDVTAIAFFNGVTGHVLDSKATVSGGNWTNAVVIHSSAAGGEIRDSIISAVEMNAGGNVLEIRGADVVNTKIALSGTCGAGCNVVDAGINTTFIGCEITGTNVDRGRYTGCVFDVTGFVNSPAIVNCVDAQGGGFAPMLDNPVYP